MCDIFNSFSSLSKCMTWFWNIAYILKVARTQIFVTDLSAKLRLASTVQYTAWYWITLSFISCTQSLFTRKSFSFKVVTFSLPWLSRIFHSPGYFFLSWVCHGNFFRTTKKALSLVSSKSSDESLPLKLPSHALVRAVLRPETSSLLLLPLI